MDTLKKRNIWIPIVGIIIFIAVIISILLVTGFFSYILSDSNAKYVNNNKWNHYFESNGFFFSSNKLRENSKKTIINFYKFHITPPYYIKYTIF